MPTPKLRAATAARKAPLTDAEFVAAWHESSGKPVAVSKATGIAYRAVLKRRVTLAEKGIVLHTAEPDGGPGPRARRWTPLQMKPAQRLNLTIEDGVVIVFSDAHYWPGIVSASHQALLTLIEQLRPRIVIANGDLLDGARISRHDRIGWEQQPTLAQELRACQARTGEIEAVVGAAELVWNQGNHDARFETYLSKRAPELEGLPGATLPEHFPRWTFSMSTVLNANSDHPVMVKHRHHNGVHAAYNNTMKAGISTVTGHLHRLVVTSWGDYRGRRYGVDTGTLADPHGPQFTYTEDAPTSAGEGFAVLTFRDGRLLPPELVEVVDGMAVFRGEAVGARKAAA